MLYNILHNDWITDFCVFFSISCILYIENGWIKGLTLLYANKTKKAWKWCLKLC